MKRTHICTDYSKAQEALLPILRGRVFHVTCAANLEGILRESAILTNEDGALPTTFGSSTNSFFRNRGCVPVFDYRDIEKTDLQHALMACSPWQPAADCDDRLAFLFLGNSGTTRLCPWTDWKLERAFSEMVVPYAEAGHPGPIPVDALEEILEVTFERGPDYPFVQRRRSEGSEGGHAGHAGTASPAPSIRKGPVSEV